MKKMLGVIILFQSLSVIAQDDLEKARIILKDVVQHYSAAKNLSFSIVYRYADENNAGVWLDSLNGKFKIHGNDYWYALANTETIGNRECTIVLFKDDKIMYIRKPVKWEH
jgi:hypothetical protein